MKDDPAVSRPRYLLTTGHKFIAALAIALIWFVLTWYAASPWIDDLAREVSRPAVLTVVMLIALVPGFMNAFLVAGLLLDRRPPYAPLARYPPVSLLIAAYNEEASIRETVRSVMDQHYPGEWELLVLDDGSTDKTVSVLQSVSCPRLRVFQAVHRGKAPALNEGLDRARYDWVVTLDADTYLFPESLARLVARICRDPPNTAAVAGAVLAKNSRLNWITRMQEWDYFHGIASVKRLQSLYQGTLVAQGAFSVFRKAAIREVGGWPETVGEDIVQTWALLERGYRIGFAENAVAFTTVPTTYRGFFRQRRRWARGLIEAFKAHPRVLILPRVTTMFIYWNALFPLMDFLYVLLFIPGMIAALFGYYDIAGPMTLAVVPLTLLINGVMFRVQRRMFEERGLNVRRNVGGFLLYIFAFQLVMAPASIAGYLAELAGLRKGWGTK